MRDEASDAFNSPLLPNWNRMFWGSSPEMQKFLWVADLETDPKDRHNVYKSEERRARMILGDRFSSPVFSRPFIKK